MSNAIIAEHINSTRTSVSKSVSKLVKLGFVQREVVFGKNNKLPIGKKLSVFEDFVCVIRKGSCVEALTINQKVGAQAGAGKASSVVSMRKHNNSSKKRNYNIDELEAIDTLDIID